MDLVTAINKRSLLAVRRALHAGVDVNSMDIETGEVPLALAAFEGQAKIVQLLLEHGALPSPKVAVTPPLIAATQGRHANVVKLLLAHGADPDVQDEEGATALIEAAAGGDRKTITTLLESGATCKLRAANGDTPVLAAAHKGHWDLVELLKPHSWAEDRNLADSLRAVASQQVPEENVVHFLRAALDGDLATVEQMLGKGMPVDASNRYGTTALFRAANRGHVDIVKLLLAKGADPCHRDMDGETPLSLSAMNSDGPEVTNLLFPLADPADRTRVLKRLERDIPRWPAWKGWSPPAVRRE